ncbi:EAL domain-containing protein [Enterovibrio sp. ZSDZ42]|uniref:EAL domain-containing protein n=1 Tax=Enterovibrio gelatinilyticus TaxID=2899819 RepID=A0ABT5R4Y0_9GAMM|nr:GGDEF domain-containing phosphodiesterase [Enterovibrio sp. ZSDZ42]MDD1795328.1 EAL domain-containing protein [Enterovibrio sp. ZSDZ42]
MIQKFSGPKAPLLKRFVASVMLVSLIGGVLLSVIIASIQLNRLNDQKEDSARLRLESIIDSAAYAAFNLDSAQGYSLLKGFDSDTLFDHIVLLDNYEDIIAEITQPTIASTESELIEFLLPAISNDTITYPLVFPVHRNNQYIDENVGYLVGSINYQTSQREFLELVSTIALSTLGEVLLVAIILSIFFHRQIGRPLSSIIESIDRSARLSRHKNATIGKVKGHTSDEFGRLVDAYNNSVMEAFSYMRDLERTKAELKSLSEKDPLTNVTNRRALLTELTTRCRHESVFHVVSLDIDNFGSYNDAYGHQIGDALLVTLADALKNTMPPEVPISRTGGDEFVFLLPGDLDKEEISNIVSPILTVCLSDALPGGTHSISCSIGVASYPEHGQSPQQLLHATDIALYVAKDAGRKCIRFYDKQADLAKIRQEEIRNALQQTIEKKNFNLLYQPKVSMETGLVTGCEALLRLHPDISAIHSHVEIIEEAERTGLIVALGREVMHRAFSDMSKVLDALPESFRFSVNVSPRQFVSEGFIADLVTTSNKHGVPLENLDIEITESSQMFDTTSSNEVRQWLKNAGVTVTLDDFGTGFASLEYLMTYGFDQIKIDKHFTQSLPLDDDAKAIFNVVQYLADKLDMSVVAEGVETAEQVAYLLNQGFDCAQGYYYSTPLSLEAFLPFVIQQQPTEKKCV